MRTTEVKSRPEKNKSEQEADGLELVKKLLYDH